MLQQHTILGHVTLIEHISDNELRITNGGYDSDEADIIDILPPYPSKVPSKITTRDEFLKLYTGPETLKLQTLPHEIPKPIRTPRYTVEKEKEIEKQVNDMLNSDMIEPSRTPYLSRINLVKKKNNEWRFVVDFRAINKIIQP
uniref:Reverse transcriptase domain-containing protein n=1 Tax=Strongyloides stercoralis TaxID=6248 RepID=A0A0K0EF50_STRER